jgi:hypothetical protein
MKRTHNLIVLSLAAWGLAALPCGAQTATTPPVTTVTKTQSNAVEDWIKSVKTPCKEFTWGADLRLRNEYFDNALSLSQRRPRHEQDYFRFRERVWASIMPITNLSVNARLAAEQREWMKPTFAKQANNESGFEERYAILDNANVKWNNIADLPLTITAGRQDIAFGDPLNWWLVVDGTPYDGSWTTFLDAVRLTSVIADGIKTKFDLVYIHQEALPDDRIPTIGRSSKNVASNGKSAPYWLTEQNEQGIIAYLSNKSLKNFQVDGYFIYKRDSQETAIPSPYGTPLGDNAEIYTAGGVP